MYLKTLVEPNMNCKRETLLISLDVKGAFDSAWWPSILNQLKLLNCPRNLYKLVTNYLSERLGCLCLGSIKKCRPITIGCSQGSCCGPGLWNILFDSLLKLDYPSHTFTLAYADDFLIIITGKDRSHLENLGNLVLDQVFSWAKLNKIVVNCLKSKALLISTKRKIYF